MSLYGKKIKKLITRTLFAIDKITIAIIMIILLIGERHVCILFRGIIITLLQFFFSFVYSFLQDSNKDVVHNNDNNNNNNNNYTNSK